VNEKDYVNHSICGVWISGLDLVEQEGTDKQMF